ncbi:MAG: hypothetical protein GY797_06690 [Deltaproteobacteria bacterium]|nr:hypothetical protein [Deltaproteobacteria bacterium]
MTYKIPNLPSAKAYKEEIADFWEIQALRNSGQYISKTQISRIIATGLDEIEHEGIESEDDKLSSDLDDVLIEMQRRQDFTSGKYPFSFKKYSLKLDEEASLFKDVYLYLLLSTRFNMKTARMHNGIDGTLLFEELCAIVASNYFGEGSESYIFGTANPGNFANKIGNLVHKIGEGKSFKNPNNNDPTKNDDAVDIVAWRNFADKRIGKLIAFGQCKTGTTWQDSIRKLNPTDFCDNWFLESPILSPLPLVFICDTLNEDFNFSTSQKGYLVFNRFRILEQIEDNLGSIENQIRSWLDGAIRQL